MQISLFFLTPIIKFHFEFSKNSLEASVGEEVEQSFNLGRVAMQP